MISKYEAVIGLEIHVQLNCASKAFCFASNHPGDEPNSAVGFVSMGLPGALPVLNREVVKKAALAGLALNAEVQKRSVFARKNYFYPDLPKGYQISQFDEPICLNGKVEICTGRDDGSKWIRIERLHIEEDAGKLQHLASNTFIDLNRAGTPLVEIVSHPDLRHPKEVSAYMKKVYETLVFAGVCDGNLEEGNFRADINTSIRLFGEEKLGTRTEIKNMNSFRFAEKATEYEIARQISVLEAGGKIVQETRGWDAAANKTYTMREKEEAHDYRYFPDPDLPPLQITEDELDDFKRSLPRLPEQIIQEFQNKLGLGFKEASQMAASPELLRYFESLLEMGCAPKTLAHWIQGEVLAEANRRSCDLDSLPLAKKNFARLLQIVEKGEISTQAAKKVFTRLFEGDKDPDELVEELGLKQISDSKEIDTWIAEVLAEFPDQVAECKAGTQKIFGFLVGQCMKKSKGRANPQLINESLMKALKK